MDFTQTKWDELEEVFFKDVKIGQKFAITGGAVYIKINEDEADEKKEYGDREVEFMSRQICKVW